MRLISRHILAVLGVGLLSTCLTAQRPLKKFYYLDSLQVRLWTSKATPDTGVTLLDYNADVNYNYQIFYDKQYTRLKSETFQKNDTMYRIHYYRNGQKKEETRGTHILSPKYYALWCENGQIIVERKHFFEGLETLTVYYCSGKIKAKQTVYNGLTIWGVEKGWYENGIQSYEKVYPEFDEKLYKSKLLKNELKSETHWDSTGVVIKKQ